MADIKPPTIKQFADWSGGLNRTGSRTRIKDTELFFNENVQPIGAGQQLTLAPRGPVLATIAPGIATLFPANLLLGAADVARIITVNKDGSMSSVNPVNGGVAPIGPAGTFSTLARVTVQEDTPLLIIDPVKGYFSWDGTTLLKYPVAFTGHLTTASPVIDTIVPNTTGLKPGMAISTSGVPANGIPAGAEILTVNSPTQVTMDRNATANHAAPFAFQIGFGAPTSGRDIAVFEGRVWIITASRTITFTAPPSLLGGSYTQFSAAAGAGSARIPDSIFIGSITRLLSALQVLWILGPAAINAISNVQVGGVPVLTTFSDTNIAASVGSVFPSSAASFFRSFLFLAPYGVYAIVGATPQKLSDSLDGLFPLLDFGDDAPSATFTVNSVFVWAVLVTYRDPDAGPRPMMLAFARNAWFLISQGDDLRWIVGLVDPATGSPNLWGTDGVNIFRCFAGDVAGFFDWRTKLWDFGEFTTRKQLMDVAGEFTSDDVIEATLTAENESTIAALDTEIVPQNTLNFLPVVFVEPGLDPIVWVSSGVSLARGRVESFEGNYLGLRISGTSKPFIISALAFRIEPRGPWTIGPSG